MGDKMNDEIAKSHQVTFFPKRECPDCLQLTGQKIPCDTCDGFSIIDYTQPVFAVFGEKAALRILQEDA